MFDKRRRFVPRIGPWHDVANVLLCAKRPGKKSPITIRGFRHFEDERRPVSRRSPGTRTPRRSHDGFLRGRTLKRRRGQRTRTHKTRNSKYRPEFTRKHWLIYAFVSTRTSSLAFVNTWWYRYTRVPKTSNIFPARSLGAVSNAPHDTCNVNPSSPHSKVKLLLRL